METNMETKEPLKIVLLFLILAFFTIGVGAGFYSVGFTKGQLSKIETIVSLEQELSDIKYRVDSNFGDVSPIHDGSALVKQIEGSVLTLGVFFPPNVLPLPNESFVQEDRSVTITSATEITEQVYDPAEGELVEKNIQLEDLHVGDRIVVRSEVDIKEQKEFEATYIMREPSSESENMARQVEDSEEAQ